MTTESAPATAEHTEAAGGHGGGHGGTTAILAALGANLGIATAKFIAYLVTGASSMLAEAIHSVADSGNQALLLIGGRSRRLPGDPRHTLGLSGGRAWSTSP